MIPIATATHTWLQLKATPSCSLIPPYSFCQLQGWSTQQVSLFLEYLLTYVEDAAPLSEQVLLSLNGVYGFTKSGNAEIRFRWQSLCLQSDVAWIGEWHFPVCTACSVFPRFVHLRSKFLAWWSNHLPMLSYWFSHHPSSILSLRSSGCDCFRDVTRAHEVRASAVQSTDAVQERQRCSDSNIHAIQKHVRTCRCWRWMSATWYL